VRDANIFASSDAEPPDTSLFLFRPSGYGILAGIMSKSSSGLPIPTPPVGKTFKVAAGILSAFLVLQILAIAWFFLPDLQQAIVRRAVAEKPTPTEAAPAPQANAEAVPQTTPAPATEQPDEANYEKITELVADSDKAYRIGDHDLGLAKIREADRLLPNDPGIMLRIARLHEKRGEPDQASLIYNSVLSLPGLSEELLKQTRRKLSMLTPPETTSAPTMVAAAEGADMRDESGLQPGSILGIVDTKLSDNPEGTKKLLISIKGRPDESIDTTQMTVHVFFYDRDPDGEVRLTDSKIITEWISPPVNWSDNEPEILNATYTPPDPSDPANTDVRFIGYVVGIYYKGELQDSRADPGSLASQHPLPIYLSSQTP
jgi:hypothetical protein